VLALAVPAREPAVTVTDAGASSAASDRTAVALDAWSQGETVDVLWSAPLPSDSYPLFHARSKDGGRTFSAATRIGAEWAEVHAPHRGTDPQIAAAGDRVIAVWTSPGTSKWGTGPLAVAVSNDGGRTWSRGGNPADDNSTDGHGFIDVAADPAGSFHAVWLDGRDGDQGLRVASSADGVAWRPNTSVDAVTCECCWNDLAVLGPGRLAVLYRDRDPRDMAVAVSEDGARSWERRGVAGAFEWKIDGCPHVGGGLAALGAGVESGAPSSSPGGATTRREALHALVWTGAPGHAGLYDVASFDGGRNWGEPTALGGSGARHGDLAAAAGALVAAWDEGAAIFAARSTDGSTWSEPRRLTPPGIRASHPLVVATASGALVLWTESASDSAPTRWAAARF
jgi:hypothetical protein